MDDRDRELAEELRQQLEASGAKVAFGDSAGANADDSEDGANTKDGASAIPEGANPTDTMDPTGLVDGPFAEAMRAYRRAKASGDAKATAEAERRLQEVVRAEMLADERCANDGEEDGE